MASVARTAAALCHGFVIHGEPFAGGDLRFAVTRGAPGAVTGLLIGATRANLPFLSCTQLVTNFFPIGIVFQLQGTSGARPGTAVIPTRVPAGLTGTVTAQAVSLDAQAMIGLTLSRGAEARL